MTFEELRDYLNDFMKNKDIGILSQVVDVSDKNDCLLLFNKIIEFCYLNNIMAKHHRYFYDKENKLYITIEGTLTHGPSRITAATKIIIAFGGETFKYMKIFLHGNVYNMFKSIQSPEIKTWLYLQGFDIL